MPEREIDEDILNFHFIAIATSTYDDDQLPDLPEVRSEVKALAGWFCDKKLADRVFTHKYPKLAKDPTKAQIEAALRGPVQAGGGGNQMPSSCTSPATAGTATKTTGCALRQRTLMTCKARPCGRPILSAGWPGLRSADCS